jgi:hypothetical protein
MDAEKKLEEVNRIMQESGKDNSEFTGAFMKFMGATMGNGALDQKNKRIAGACPGYSRKMRMVHFIPC